MRPSHNGAVLQHVVLGSNPQARIDAGGWPWLAERTWDVRSEPSEGRSGWSVACNVKRIGHGTLGWIHRWAGAGLGELAAIIVFDESPKPVKETNGVVHYCGGHLIVLNEPVSGERIASAPVWSGAAPYHHGRARQFQSGRRVLSGDADVLLDLLSIGDTLRLLDALLAAECRTPVDPRTRSGVNCSRLGLRPSERRRLLKPHVVRTPSLYRRGGDAVKLSTSR